MLSAAAAESGTWPEIGACAVFRSVNRLIAGGAAVSGAFIQVQTTADTSPALADAISSSAAQACQTAGIRPAIARADGPADLKEPTVTATVFGQPGSLFAAQPPQPGQDLLMTGFAGLTGASRLAREHRAELEKRFAPSYRDEIARAPELRELQIYDAVLAAASAGAGAFYALDDGGVNAGLWNFGEECGLGMRVRLREIPVTQVTIEICNELDENPYELLSLGAVLMTAGNGRETADRLAEQGIEAAVIGYMTGDHDRIFQNGDNSRYMVPYKADNE